MPARVAESPPGGTHRGADALASAHADSTPRRLAGFGLGGELGGRNLFAEIARAGVVASVAPDLGRMTLFWLLFYSRAWVTALGAAATIDHSRDLRAELDHIDIAEVDAVALFADTDPHFAALPSLLRPQGRAVAIVGTTRPVDLGILMSKSISFHWELMFTRPMHRTDDMIAQHDLLDRIADWVDAGELKSTIQQRFSPIDAANLRRAHALLESNRTIGKITLEGWG